jgi:hypothetical protein
MDRFISSPIIFIPQRAHYARHCLRRPGRDEMRLNRHCERSEAIHRAAWTEWIASSLSLLAMTAKSVIEPEISAL